MAARSDPMASLFPEAGHRLATFAGWFERTATEQVAGGRWWEKHLERAYQSGANTGGEMVGSPPPGHAPVPAVYRELAAREFAAIAATMVQHVSRQAAAASVAGRKPLPLYQRVLAVLRKVGQARMKAAVNYMTVQLHNAARLAAFRAAGVTRVALVPERLEPPRPSRFLRHDHLVLDATREELALAAALRRAEELFARLRAQAEAEAAKAEVAAEVARAALEKQIAAELAGAPIPELGAAQARAEAEVAAAKAATAAREVRASAAWEKVKAARRAVALASPARAQAAAQAQPERVVPPGYERVAAETVGKATIPARLLAVGSEYVNSQTAGDDRVCIVCQDISAEGPYTLAEAQGLLPAHPNCRCAWVPAFDMRYAVNRELAAAEAE